ncbi:MAG: rhodanese-like domain-containing protein [Bacteroidota bacterium]
MRVFLFSVVLILAQACATDTSREQTPVDAVATAVVAEKLDVAAFAQKLASLPNAQLVDVRTPEECAGGMIEKAINHNFYDDDFKDKMLGLDKEQPVMVYCKAGGRSAKALSLLKGLGFKEIYDLQGGYTAWAATNQ